MPRSSRLPAIAAAALLAAALAGAPVALAQDGGAPGSIPRGQSSIRKAGRFCSTASRWRKGELLTRVGDWERPTAIPVRGGAFDCGDLCLLAGPPGVRLRGRAGHVSPERRRAGRRTAGRLDLRLPAARDAVPRGRAGDVALRRGRRRTKRGAVPGERHADSDANAYSDAHCDPRANADRGANAYSATAEPAPATAPPPTPTPTATAIPTATPGSESQSQGRGETIIAWAAVAAAVALGVAGLAFLWRGRRR